MKSDLFVAWSILYPFWKNTPRIEVGKLVFFHLFHKNTIFNRKNYRELLDFPIAFIWVIRQKNGFENKWVTLPLFHYLRSRNEGKMSCESVLLSFFLILASLNYKVWWNYSYMYLNRIRSIRKSIRKPICSKKKKKFCSYRRSFVINKNVNIEKWKKMSFLCPMITGVQFT